MKCTRPFPFWRLPHRRRSVNPRMVFIISLFPCLCNIFRVFYSWFIHSFYFRRLVHNLVSRIQFVVALGASVCLEEHSVTSVMPFCVLPSFSKLVILIGTYFEFCIWNSWIPWTWWGLCRIATSLYDSKLYSSPLFEAYRIDNCMSELFINPYPTAFPYGNGMGLHFYQQQESSMTKTVHKVINKGLKTYV